MMESSCGRADKENFRLEIFQLTFFTLPQFFPISRRTLIDASSICELIENFEGLTEKGIMEKSQASRKGQKHIPSRSTGELTAIMGDCERRSNDQASVV
jgi:hypothetical protein